MLVYHHFEQVYQLQINYFPSQTVSSPEGTLFQGRQGPESKQSKLPVTVMVLSPCLARSQVTRMAWPLEHHRAVEWNCYVPQKRKGKSRKMHLLYMLIYPVHKYIYIQYIYISNNTLYIYIYTRIYSRDIQKISPSGTSNKWQDDIGYAYVYIYIYVYIT